MIFNKKIVVVLPAYNVESTLRQTNKEIPFDKINFLSLLSAPTGGMASIPGLSAAELMTETEAPQIVYAAVYPFSLVLVSIIAEVLSLF